MRALCPCTPGDLNLELPEATSLFLIALLQFFLYIRDLTTLSLLTTSLSEVLHKILLLLLN